MEKTLTVIDLSSIFWQVWHGTADQEVGTAYDSVIRKIYRYATEDQPIAIAVDYPPYIRKTIFPDYKAQRDTPSEVAVEQLRRIKQTLRDQGFPVLEAEGYEADDIIATIVAHRNTPDETIPVHIVSSDKDLMQLVDPTVTQESPLTGETLDPDGVKEKFGVWPPELLELLAMCGDKVDNVPGIPGIGIKTAAAIINGDKINNGVQKKLNENQDALDLSRKLITLFSDAPIDVSTCFLPRAVMKKKTADPIVFDNEPEETTENASDRNETTHETVQNEKCGTSDVQTEIAVKTAPTAPKNQIVKRDQSWTLALEPISTGNAVKLSEILFESRLYTKFSNPQQILAVMLRGRALGMDATTALDGFHVIEGRPALSAPLIEGLVIQSPLCDYFECIESTPERATYITHRRGSNNPEPTRMTYTFAEAEQAELTNLTKNGRTTNWHKRPKTMLRHRCATELARMVYPDIVAGLYTPDEISDVAVIEGEIVA